MCTCVLAQVRHGGRLVAALLLGWGAHMGSLGSTATPQMAPAPAAAAGAAAEASGLGGGSHKQPANGVATVAGLMSATRGNGGAPASASAPSYLSPLSRPEGTAPSAQPQGVGITAAANGEAPAQTAGVEVLASSNGMTLSPKELGQLQRLAQFLVFGIYADPQHARTLEAVSTTPGMVREKLQCCAPLRCIFLGRVCSERVQGVIAGTFVVSLFTTGAPLV